MGHSLYDTFARLSSKDAPWQKLGTWTQENTPPLSVPHIQRGPIPVDQNRRAPVAASQKSKSFGTPSGGEFELGSLKGDYKRAPRALAPPSPPGKKRGEKF